jgi:hypothetical protein
MTLESEETSGSSQDRSRILQDAKVRAPSMPNNIHGHREPDI